jgi:hypothetical protein
MVKKIKIKRKNYNLPIQTVRRFASSPTNCQCLDSDPPNYQKVLKRHILSKYAYNTSAMCHFQLKKKPQKLLKKKCYNTSAMCHFQLKKNPQKLLKKKFSIIYLLLP